MKPFCHIHIYQPASPSSSDKPNANAGDDFYAWVNNEWMEAAEMPGFENDFGLSEEVERCIYKKSVEIIDKEKSTCPILKCLEESFMHSSAQDKSVEYLKSILSCINLIDRKDEIVKHLSALAHSRINSIFKYSYNVNPSKISGISLCADTPGLDISFYNDARSAEYKKFLNAAGDLFGISNLSQVYSFEKTLSDYKDRFSEEGNYHIHGGKLLSKFPQIPWNLWFSASDLHNWKSMTFFYDSPRWIRFVGRALRDVPLDFWKMYVSKIYICHALTYLPGEYSDLDFEFFGSFIQGQKVKSPKKEQLVNTIYKYLPDMFSELFWKEAGDPLLVKEMSAFSGSLVAAAKERVKRLDWMHKFTKAAAIDKINRMTIQIVKPDEWFTDATPKATLDPKNVLKNIYDLGAFNINLLFSRNKKKYVFWDEGIFRVNAYYFNENNSLIIPYGTIMHPFYSRELSDAWNYGALGSIIGHEICHGFDEDGRYFLPNGVKKNWWTRSDAGKYSRKIRDLEKMFSSEIVCGKHVDGSKTVSENIADLGGIAICVEALKESQRKRGVTGDAVKKEFREFFIAFATSWRTKYRKEKLKMFMTIDTHSPAFLRVNLVVSQLQEWYDAFDIREGALYRKPEDRIVIF